MNIIKIINGVPSKFTQGALKRENPGTSFPSPLNDALLANYGCFTYTIDPKPSYDKVLQYVKSKFKKRDTGWVEAWDIIDFEEDAAKSRLKNKITSDRWDVERGGVEWDDSSGDFWLIGTDENSQMKMTSVLSMLNADPSSNGYASWKMDKRVSVTYPDFDTEGNEIQKTHDVWQKNFRHNTLEDWNEMVTLVGSHIKNCFLAEEIAISKAEGGDLNVTFESEFRNL